MKKIITSAFIIALSIGIANAQTTPDRPAKETRKEHKMAFDQLNLTADQKAHMQSLKADYKKQMADLKSNSQLTADEQKSRRKELHQQYKAKMEALLTPAQKDQLAKMKADRKANHKEGKGRTAKGAQAWKQGEKGKGFGEAFQKELNLTSEQQTKLAGIRSEYKDKFQSLRNDQSLSQENKKAKFHELMKEQKQEMKTVLTPEQLQKLQSLRKEHTGKNTK